MKQSSMSLISKAILGTQIVLFFLSACGILPSPHKKTPATETMPLPHPAGPKTSEDTSLPDIQHKAQIDYDVALAAMKAGHYKEAEQRLRTMSRTYPNYSGPHANLGILYYREGNVTAAEQALTEAVRLNPGNYMAYNQLGILYRSSGHFEKARHAYEEALRANPDYANAHLNLGILDDLFLRDYGQALYHYQRYMQISGGQDKQVSLWITDLRQRMQKPADNSKRRDP